MKIENLSTLKIHRLTRAQYEREREAGRLDAGALYLTPDETDSNSYVTTEQFDKTIGDIEAVLDSIISIQNNLIGGDSV